MGRWRTARLTHPNANAISQQLPVILRQPLRGGEHTPDTYSRRDEITPVGAVGVARNGNTHEGVEQGKTQPREQAHRCITDAEFKANGFHQYAEDLSVNEVEGVGDDQDGQHITARSRRKQRRRRAGRRRCSGHVGAPFFIVPRLWVQRAGRKCYGLCRWSGSRAMRILP